MQAIPSAFDDFYPKQGVPVADYANDVLVDTQWVENHLNDASVRIVEVDENPALYAEAHIPGAIGFDWKKDLQDQVKRDFLGPEAFGELFGSRGISNDRTIVLYGDRNNWFAAYTYWYLHYAGHIPGAASVPWAQAVREDGTFKSASELSELYGSKGVIDGEPVIAYCRIGERSAHTWFVLHELLGRPDVKNYDGSWTEWGNLVNVPIEKG